MEDRATGAVAVYVSPAFEQSFITAAEMQEYVESTRCLPLYALARIVAQQDLPQFSDAAFQAMYLGDGNGMTSVIVRVSRKPACPPARLPARRPAEARSFAGPPWGFGGSVRATTHHRQPLCSTDSPHPHLLTPH